MNNILDLRGLEAELTKGQSKNEYLADLYEIRKVYVQDAIQSYSIGILPQEDTPCQALSENIEKQKKESLPRHWVNKLPIIRPKRAVVQIPLSVYHKILKSQAICKKILRK